MNMLIASLMFILLLAMSAAHFVWSVGKTWPIRGEKLLAQTVIGTQNVEHMPPRLQSFAIALGALIAGVVALSLADHDGGGPLLTLAAVPLAAVFLARGVVGYTPSWIDRTPEPNFRLNDRRVYSPVCLFLGLGFAALVAMRLL